RLGDHQREGRGREDPSARWVPRNPGAAPETETRLRYLCRLAGVRDAERPGLCKAVPDLPGSRVQRGRRADALGVVSNGPAARIGADRPARTAQDWRVGLLHRRMVA